MCRQTRWRPTRVDANVAITSPRGLDRQESRGCRRHGCLFPRSLTRKISTCHLCMTCGLASGRGQRRGKTSTTTRTNTGSVLPSSSSANRPSSYPKERTTRSCSTLPMRGSSNALCARASHRPSRRHYHPTVASRTSSRRVAGYALRTCAPSSRWTRWK